MRKLLADLMSSNSGNQTFSINSSARGAIVTRKKTTGLSTTLAMGREKTSAPYRLRDTSKLPSRYRDDDLLVPATKVKSPVKTRSPSKNSTPSGSPARRAIGRTPGISSISTPKTATGSVEKKAQLVSPTDLIDDEAQNIQTILDNSLKTDANQRTLAVPSSSYQPLLHQGRSVPRIIDDSFGNTPESSQSSLVENDYPTSEAARSIILRKIARQRSQNEIGDVLRESLRKLKNLLKLPKARRWVVCEFFYSGVDEQLFLGDNEFTQIIKESFPNLKTMMMNKQEWRVLRRLLGKPRRCSPTFFHEERQSLEQKRQKIRSIYEGTYLSDPNYDISDLPLKLPRPLVVGMRVYARIRSPKDGIYAGTIDALIQNGYRIVFEKEDMLPPALIPDSEVMLDGLLELVSISYFIEQGSAKLPYGMNRIPQNISNSVCVAERPYSKHDIIAQAQSRHLKKTAHQGNYEKVGNFPVRMLVILVKLSKLIELKKKLVRQLTELNLEAERVNLLTDTYHPTFQEKYAQTVVDLEALNRQMGIYLQGIQEYNTQLLPQLSEVHVTARPEALRKLCATHSQQIVKHCNQGLNVTNKRGLTLVTSLTSLLLQIRSLGQQKLTPLDLHTLSESINEIRSQISPKNAAWFQDHVEVHMKQIHNMMLQSGAMM